MKEQKIKEEVIEWDKKKILLFIITLFILIILGYELKTIFLDENSLKNNPPLGFSNQSVKGSKTQNLENSNIKQDIQNQIENLKEEAQNINIIEIASSSAQVQKVINDLKALQDLPSNKIKDACQQICSGL